MDKPHRQFDWLEWPWLPAAVPASVRTFLAVLLGTLVLMIPHIRVAEYGEGALAKEQIEDATLAVRVNRKVRPCTKVENYRVVITHFTLRQAGQCGRQDLAPADGHRLPNGLLAPITC